MLGVADPRAISRLITHMAALDSSAVLHQIHELSEAGADLRQVNAQVVEYWRALMLTKAGADAAAILDLTEDEMREVKQLSQLFGLEELTECARVFAQNDLVQKNQGTPQLGLELASLECIELHRRAHSNQLGQLQAELGSSLVLLHKVILREDSRALGQFLKSKKLRELLHLAHLIFCEVQNSSSVRTSFGKHQGAPVLYYLGVDLAQVCASFGKFMNLVQYSRTIECCHMRDQPGNSVRVGYPKHSLHLHQRDFFARIGNGLI